MLHCFTYCLLLATMLQIVFNLNQSTSPFFLLAIFYELN
jgi:hypothetical protein